MLGQRAIDLLGITIPIIQAPMAGSSDVELAVAVAEAGGLGSLPCALLSADDVRTRVRAFRDRTARPLNLNFFCHRPPEPSEERQRAWRSRLEPYYVELGVDATQTAGAPARMPFDETMCRLVEDCRPEVVSFHFGLPDRSFVGRVKATGARILSSATTVEEGRWLEREGCDAVIAQGAEAGGHRGMFLTTDVARQVGTIALTPQLVDALRAPVIAAGAVSDARGIAAAFALGAAGVQIGSAYLRCPECRTSAVHRRALDATPDDATAITNLMTGRPARGVMNRLMRDIGPMSAIAPAFPEAATAVMPLRARAESQGSGDFSPLWAGQAAGLAREQAAGELTRGLWSEALTLLSRLGDATR